MDALLIAAGAAVVLVAAGLAGFGLLSIPLVAYRAQQRRERRSFTPPLSADEYDEVVRFGMDRPEDGAA